jgi:hypothetical protein
LTNGCKEAVYHKELAGKQMELCPGSLVGAGARLFAANPFQSERLGDNMKAIIRDHHKQGLLLQILIILILTAVIYIATNI